MTGNKKKLLFDFDHPNDIAWCPGCGNFSILQSLKAALDGMGMEREKVVVVSGIGQAAKTPHYINASFFNGLHGRSLPPPPPPSRRRIRASRSLSRAVTAVPTGREEIISWQR